jgi:5'-nucleotidase
MREIVIPDQDRLDGLKKKILTSGSKKLHVVSDFDRTLTKAFVDGEKTPSVISELRKGNYISEDYSKRASVLADKYHPIEINPEISMEEKKKEMHEWWSKHFQLLIESGLEKEHIQRVVENGRIQPREGTLEFLDLLNEKRIPLVILSSAGLGEESIRMFLEKYRRMWDNIHIISNAYVWSPQGKAVGVKEPIIHIFNKDETTVHEFPFYNQIRSRKNVLLLGDSIGDLGMIHGFDYDALLKVGFLNEDVEKNLETYKKNFDVVVLNDGSMDYVSSFIRDIK